MTNEEFTAAIGVVLDELLDGAWEKFGFVLNPSDSGLLRSLDLLSAEAASAIPAGARTSIAAHVDHLRYGFSLLNQWSAGASPFSDADYSASWKRIRVTESEWVSRRDELRREAYEWRDRMRKARDPLPSDWPAVVASTVHLAYHLGAIRQMNRAIRGPVDGGPA